VKEIIPGDEPLTPGILYVGIATLTGSVIARNRKNLCCYYQAGRSLNRYTFPGTILLRAVLPPSLFFLSLPYFLPKTSHNLSTYFSSLERKYFPSLAEQHDALSSSLSSATEGARKTLTSFRHDVRRRVDWGVGEIQRLTGLKFDEARQLVEKGEKEARGVAQAASDVLTGKTEEQKPPKRLV
jgi:organizing structure protein 2